MAVGWAVPEGSRTAHYYVGAWSLCRRLAPAPATLAADPPRVSCGACRRAAAIRVKMLGVQRAELTERATPPAWTPPSGQPPPRKRRGRASS